MKTIKYVDFGIKMWTPRLSSYVIHDYYCRPLTVTFNEVTSLQQPSNTTPYIEGALRSDSTLSFVVSGKEVVCKGPVENIRYDTIPRDLVLYLIYPTNRGSSIQDNSLTEIF